MKTDWLFWQLYVWLTSSPPLKSSTQLLPKAFLWEPVSQDETAQNWAVVTGNEKHVLMTF